MCKHSLLIALLAAIAQWAAVGWWYMRTCVNRDLTVLCWLCWCRADDIIDLKKAIGKFEADAREERHDAKSTGGGGGGGRGGKGGPKGGRGGSRGGKGAPRGAKGGDRKGGDRRGGDRKGGDRKGGDRKGGSRGGKGGARGRGRGK